MESHYGQQPCLKVNGTTQNAPNEINTAACIKDIGPYPRNYLRNPGFNNHDLSVFKNFPFGREGKSFLQLRMEMFNFLNQTQYSAVNRTTNITNGAGATGANIFNDFTNLSITNNARPSGNTIVLGTYFGEYSAARDPRFIRLAVKVYF